MTGTGVVGRMRGSSVLGAILAASVAGCSFFPSSGPNSIAVDTGFSTSGVNYALVRLTAPVIKILAEYGPLSISATFW